MHHCRASLVPWSFELKTRRASETVSVASGEVAEWFKAHAWKACVGNTTVGSNPTLSAILLIFFGVGWFSTGYANFPIFPLSSLPVVPIAMM